MGGIIKLIHAIGVDGVVRARVLQMLRVASGAASAWVLTSVYVYLTTHFHGMNTTDAMSIAGTLAACAGGLVLGVGSAVFSWIDPAQVDEKIKDAKMEGAVLATSTPAVAIQIAQAAQSAGVTAPSGTPEALQQLLTRLQAAGGSGQ